MRKMRTALFAACIAAFLVACAGSFFEMKTTHVEKTAEGKPIKDALVIVVVDDPEIRSVFENYFKKRLTMAGVETIIGADVLPMHKGSQLEKQKIVDVVEKNGNDSVLITHLVGFDESEAFNRDLPKVYRDYYGFYQYAWGYVVWPTTYKENVVLTIETRLYDAKTESLIWSGNSRLSNPKTTGTAIGEVVDAVMRELEKYKLLPNAS